MDDRAIGREAGHHNFARLLSETKNERRGSAQKSRGSQCDDEPIYHCRVIHDVGANNDWCQ